MLIDRRFIAQFDWLTLSIALIIPMLGLVVLYSAGFEPEAQKVTWAIFEFEIFSLTMYRQFFNLLLGLLVLVIGLIVSPRLLFRYALIMYIAGVLLLIAVLLFGEVTNGSRRWLNLGIIRFQPAEFMKFAVLIFTARILSKLPTTDGLLGIKELILPMSVIVIPMFLILVQPDLGTALALGAAGMLMILYAGVRWQLIILAALIPLLALIPVSINPYQPVVIKLLKPYQQRRVMALIDPSADIRGSGWHIHQSKIAVGSGRLTGKGFLQGSQSQLRFLPEHTTDFIFSVLAEEWGFLGCILVLSLYALIIYRIIYIAGRSRDPFLTYLAFGVGAKIFFHVLVNVGMVIGLLPVVGIPLPLFSYGGTAMVANMFSLGLVLGVAMRRNMLVNQRGVD